MLLKETSLKLMLALAIGLAPFSGVYAADIMTYEGAYELAQQGDARAQYNLGQMYRMGKMAPKDDAKAVSWYQKSAKQGIAKAQFNLAYMYEWGKGVKKSYAHAIYWYKQSAKQNHVKAQVNLGLMYEKGKGVPANNELALSWYKKAAARGDEMAQCYINDMLSLPSVKQKLFH